MKADLDALTSTHPAAATLASVAQTLAMVLDSPLTVADGRIAAVVAKELRATMAVLADHEEAESDDLFGGGAPVVVPASG